MKDLSFRSIWIGAGLAVAILAVGTPIFSRLGEGALFGVWLTSFVFSILVLHFLDDRELKRKDKDSQHIAGQQPR